MEKTKTIRRRRSDSSWKKENKSKASSEPETIQYPEGPIDIVCSWNPIDRTEKPPYSYATIIGHAILTSKERKLTLHDIYVWITDNYPFYSNDTQGWQNSIRHNLSLHKSFVKIDRDPNNAQNPPRKGCFWTIRQGREKFFIDNLQKPVNSVRRQHSVSHLATGGGRRQHFLRRTSSSILPPALSSPTTSTTASSSSPSRLFHNFRTTTDVPEAEQHLPPPPSSASSDLLSSPSSSSLSGSSPTTYHQLFYNVPESTMSYNVYPTEQTDFFNTSNDYYLNSNSHPPPSTSALPPSLSPCDAYSTTSSYNDYQSLGRGSNRSSYSSSSASLYPLAHHTHIYKTANNSSNTSFALQHGHQPSDNPFMMEWASISPNTENSFLHHNTFSNEYYLQQQQPSKRDSKDFNLFHR